AYGCGKISPTIPPVIASLAGRRFLVQAIVLASTLAGSVERGVAQTAPFSNTLTGDWGGVRSGLLSPEFCWRPSTPGRPWETSRAASARKPPTSTTSISSSPSTDSG